MQIPQLLTQKTQVTYLVSSVLHTIVRSTLQVGRHLTRTLARGRTLCFGNTKMTKKQNKLHFQSHLTLSWAVQPPG